ncbi:serine hydrolase domain-containing protein [Aurantiacibacter spongiae]|uniref:Class A beta-lactamase-related serine hydrolase n=1 Tax=Aurantiacibacter spongiae TaxID=2488860 RepID=A0A3N5DNY8_9SPHN|nr:serine hydrolase domain-containing protein [Aurantiacibacter spongiae]RPF70801.1 class A beta-lactamase-related serine hydrolase [Aurantiacibacter spongiae]
MTSAISHALSRRSLIRGGALLGAGAIAGLPLAGAALAQDASGRWPAVARMVGAYVDNRRVSGMVATMGFGQARADTIARGTKTFAGDDPVGPDSLFRIYSMTKPITGMAAMMCIDDGLMALDQPLYEIIPAFRTMRVQKRYDGPITADNLEPARRPITIRHLLTHTAGLAYGIIQSGPIREAYSRRGLVPGQVSRLELAQAIMGGTPTDSLADFAQGVAEMPLVYQPGTRWSYSVALDVMGRVIEVVSGQDFDAFLRQRIFDPAGMTSTWFRVPRGEAGRLTGNYFLMGGFPIPLDMPRNSVFLDEPAFPAGGAGLVSSPSDYDRFLRMLAGYGEIDGRRVMSEAAVRMGTRDLFPDTLATNGGFTSNGLTFGFGAGGLVGKGDAEGLYGWFGAAGTSGLVNMRRALRHNLMTQYMPAEAYPTQSEFPQAVARDAARLLQS